MGRTWSVGRSVDARGPVDHDSVGLAQARSKCANCSSALTIARCACYGNVLHLHKVDAGIMSHLS